MPRDSGGLRPRLRRPDFQRATGRGRKLVSQYFLLFISDRGDSGPTRLGITVTRKVGNAIRRNRIKRLVREWFRRRAWELGPCDLVVIAKRGIPSDLLWQQVQQDLDDSLRPLARSPKRD